MTAFICDQFKKIQKLVSKIESDHQLIKKIDEAANHCIDSLKKGGKILLAGNGGSAADAQHLAAEIVGRLRFNRPALSAIALTTDTSILTAVANDSGFDEIFGRQIAALGVEQDVFIAISTSGKSPNILKALQIARAKKIKIIGFSGMSASIMDQYADVMLNVPSYETSKIQECHIMFGHIICEMIENYFFSKLDPSNVPSKISEELLA